MKVLVTTYPYSDENIKLLSNTSTVEWNTQGRKLTPEEHRDIVKSFDPDIIIAGTEKYDKDVLDLAPSLKLIARVGIGVDGIDFQECQERNIIVTNTPDAPTNAVAELTICQILALLRKSYKFSMDCQWDRHIGKELKNTTIGVVGCGRIGSSVIQKLTVLGCCDIRVCDIDPTKENEHSNTCNVTFFNELLTDCDIVTLHIPYNEQNHHLIGRNELCLMGDHAALINTSRGAIVDKDALYDHLVNIPMFSVALDVFDWEPYNGPLVGLSNVLITPHLGSCTIASRKDMENGAYHEVVSFMGGQGVKNHVQW